MTKKQSYFAQFDERQRLFAYQSYVTGFWTVIFLLWVQSVFGRHWQGILSQEFTTLAILITGVCIQICYGIVKGAHPFLHPKFTKQLSLLAPLLVVLSLGVIVWSVWTMLTVDKTLPVIFGRGGSASMLVRYLNLLAMACSFLYRKRLDKLAEVDED